MANMNLAKLIVNAEKMHIARQIAVLRQTPAGHHYSAHEISGSLTIITVAKYGRKLNHTVGFGMFCDVSKIDLEAIEKSYQVVGLPPELDMCSFVPPAVTDLLSSSSFIPDGMIDTFECDLSNMDAKPEPPECKITVDETSDIAAFQLASLTGFRTGGRPDELLGLLSHVAAQRSDTVLFLARQGSEIVGSAGMACIEVDGKRLANFYMDSAIPEFRGIGVQAALLRKRLHAAKAMGCDIAIASARSGSGSARNIERAGFKHIFVSTTYTKLPT